MKFILNLALIIGMSIGLQGQQFVDSGTIKLDMSQIKSLALYNHNGDIKVTAGNKSQGTIKYVRKLKSASTQKLEEAKNEIFLDSIHHNSELFYFVSAPNRIFEIDADGEGHYNHQGDNWNKRSRYKVEYEFTFELELPADTKLKVSNHHSGLTVTGMKGPLIANNHHKGLILKNVGSQVSANTHHGDIEVTHSSNPRVDSYYHTHHGNIKVTFQNGLGAEVSLKSHHGAFYSDFDWNYQPSKTSINSNQKGTKYKIGKDTVVRIGKGGPALDFKTHHGDIYLLNN